MALYTGSNKRLKITLDGRTYKIMNSWYDVLVKYAEEIQSGDVPENIRQDVEELLQQEN